MNPGQSLPTHCCQTPTIKTADSIEELKNVELWRRKGPTQQNKMKNRLANFFSWQKLKVAANFKTFFRLQQPKPKPKQWPRFSFFFFFFVILFKNANEPHFEVTAGLRGIKWTPTSAPFCDCVATQKEGKKVRFLMSENIKVSIIPYEGGGAAVGKGPGQQSTEIALKFLT